jgi:hypothetical protein
MTKLVNTVIEFEGRWYLVIGYNERLELLEVLDCARNFKCMIDVEGK